MSSAIVAQPAKQAMTTKALVATLEQLAAQCELDAAALRRVAKIIDR